MKVKSDHRSKFPTQNYLEVALMYVRGSPDFFQASSFQLLKLEIYCDDHSSLSDIKLLDLCCKEVDLTRLLDWLETRKKKKDLAFPPPKSTPALRIRVD